MPVTVTVQCKVRVVCRLMTYMCVCFGCVSGRAHGRAGGAGTGRAGQRSSGDRRSRGRSSTQRTVYITTIETRYHASPDNTHSPERITNICRVRYLTFMFVSVPSAAKKEEDEDDMADLEAWAAN